MPVIRRAARSTNSAFDIADRPTFRHPSLLEQYSVAPALKVWI
jgi:hypothetical protein